MIDPEAKRQLIEEISRSSLVRNACKKAGVSPASYYRMIKEDPEFKAAVQEAKQQGRELMCDAAESVILHGIQNKDIGAAKYFLSHNHESYMPQREPDKTTDPILKEKQDEKLLKRIAELEEKLEYEKASRGETINIEAKTMRLLLEHQREEFLKDLENGTYTTKWDATMRELDEEIEREK